MQKKNPIEAIIASRRIADMCNAQARKINAQIKTLNEKRWRNGQRAKVWIEASNEIDRLERIIKRLEDRRGKVWVAVTDYQGKYINWKNFHEIDGKTYSGTLELIHAANEIYYGKVEEIA